MSRFNPIARALALIGCAALVPSGIRAYAHDGSDDSGGDGDEAVAALVQPLNGPAPLATGTIEVESEDGGTEQKLEFEAKGLLLGHTYFVFLEDAVGSGVLVNVGTMWSHDDDDGDDDFKNDDGDDDDDGPGNDDGDDDDDDNSSGSTGVEAKLKFGSECGGNDLPFGVATVEELANRNAEIRDEANVVYLTGVVPSLLAPTKTRHANRTLHHHVNGTGQVRIMTAPKKPRSTFEVRLSGVKGHDHAVVRVEDPKTHVMKTVGTIALDAKGKGKIVFDTKKGQALPLGKSCNDPLCGQAIDVRDAASGQTLLTGKIPKF